MITNIVMFHGKLLSHSITSSLKRYETVFIIVERLSQTIQSVFVMRDHGSTTNKTMRAKKEKTFSAFYTS